jgi:uncharacterized membrane protein (UPF0182 family)
MTDDDLIRRTDALAEIALYRIDWADAYYAIAALPPAKFHEVEAIREMTETDHANIIAHLSPELTPTGPLPNRNSLMMEVVRLRNQVKALVDAKAGGVEFDWGQDVGREVLPR